MKRPVRPLPWSEAVRQSDSQERTRFLESHVDLVRYLALRIASRLPSSVEVEDLVHDGIVGLLDAVNKYNPARKVRFRTYAEARIRGAILDGLRQKDWRPRSVRRSRRELDDTVSQLTAEKGRAVTPEEIASAMGLTSKEYRSVLRDASSGPLLSLEELIGGPGSAPSEVSPGPDALLERRQLIEAVAQELTHLPERERRVMELYYHEGLNMKEVGAVLGVTESRVCQMHSQAASRLRAALLARMHAGGAPEETVAAGGGRR